MLQRRQYLRVPLVSGWFGSRSSPDTRRGYPSSVLQHVPYDVDRRNELLAALRSRDRFAPRAEPKEMLVFKCPYGVHLKHLRILKECNKLVRSLRMRLGDAFLQDVHTVCAHPVKTNLFVKTNRYNHLPTNTW